MHHNERRSFRNTAFLSILLSSTALLGSHAFSPSGLTVSGRPGFGVSSGRPSSTERFSTASPSRTTDKEGALDALETLLEKQKSEVRETENLIRRLSEIDAAEMSEEELGSEDISSFTTSGLGSSVLSGVDYGFVSRSEGCTFEDIVGGSFSDSSSSFDGYGPPANIIKLGTQQFTRNLDAMRGEYRDEFNLDLTPKQQLLQQKLSKLTLNSTAIWERERSRGPINAPLIIKVPYLVLCWLLDVVFEGRYPPARFFLLETVARMPYFSYISMLHFYETVGFWRRSADIKRIHFAEEWNEYHHLLIMESLGGDQRWWVRFMAQHSALVYNAVLSVLFAISPTLSYKFSELLETHAVDTYGQFVDENEELLKDLPPSLAAIEYYSYGSTDPLFGEYQTTAAATGREIRRPGENMKSLYDVFAAIRADEGDHVGTMKACLDPTVAVNSPSTEKKLLTGIAFAATFGYLLSTGDMTDLDGVGDMVENLLDGSGGTDATTTAIGSLIDNLIGGTTEFESEGGLTGIDPELLGAGLGTAVWEQIKGVLIDVLEFLTKL